MKLTLNGRPSGLTVKTNGLAFLSFVPDGMDFDLNEVHSFRKREAVVKLLGVKRDVKFNGFLDEISLKSKLTLKIVCKDCGELDFNALSKIMADPESSRISFDDQQATLDSNPEPEKIKPQAKEKTKLKEKKKPADIDKNDITSALLE